ncbi:DUF1622 domain-containing protein [Lichenihabitans sp. Uapishka_5]|uniref:DUF1622 domain-containing protein n=1 Tax=Lichenihabitans sp. Uapishka_5 TaxID=3037302 RepID=UPI0029E8052B|nr:DUF1622 domain-containing protein [Lichenihabitans sp. Uapishka_5]MDX7954008.1 DUF1622 domain-containing protein [Lichenihabitans sp. Uapishka_5]
MAAVLIEFGGSLFVVAGCMRALGALVLSRATHAGIVRCRLLVADGVIAALGFKTAATLLKTIELQTWNAILSFAAIFALRTVVKRFLVWEEHRLRSRST